MNTLKTALLLIDVTAPICIDIREKLVDLPDRFNIQIILLM